MVSPCVCIDDIPAFYVPCRERLLLGVSNATFRHVKHCFLERKMLLLAMRVVAMCDFSCMYLLFNP